MGIFFPRILNSHYTRPILDAFRPEPVQGRATVPLIEPHLEQRRSYSIDERLLDGANGRAVLQQVLASIGDARSIVHQMQEFGASGPKDGIPLLSTSRDWKIAHYQAAVGEDLSMLGEDHGEAQLIFRSAELELRKRTGRLVNFQIGGDIDGVLLSLGWLNQDAVAKEIVQIDSDGYPIWISYAFGMQGRALRGLRHLLGLHSDPLPDLANKLADCISHSGQLAESESASLSVKEGAQTSSRLEMQFGVLDSGDERLSVVIYRRDMSQGQWVPLNQEMRELLWNPVSSTIMS